MKRYLALIGAAVLAVSSLGSISAQNGIPVNADGSYVVANDDDVPFATGTGDNIDYGEVATGGTVGETLGDPNAVYSPNGAGQSGAGWRRTGGAGRRRRSHRRHAHLSSRQPLRMPRRRPRRISPARKAPRRRTFRSMPPRRPNPAPDATDSAAASGFCSQYATWYDAQIAYENLGTTAADPALVQEVDPNYDGISLPSGGATDQPASGVGRNGRGGQRPSGAGRAATASPGAARCDRGGRGGRSGRGSPRLMTGRPRACSHHRARCQTSSRRSRWSASRTSPCSSPQPRRLPSAKVASTRARRAYSRMRSRPRDGC